MRHRCSDIAIRIIAFPKESQQMLTYLTGFSGKSEENIKKWCTVRYTSEHRNRAFSNSPSCLCSTTQCSEIYRTLTRSLAMLEKVNGIMCITFGNWVFAFSEQSLSFRSSDGFRIRFRTIQSARTHRKYRAAPLQRPPIRPHSPPTSAPRSRWPRGNRHRCRRNPRRRRCFHPPIGRTLRHPKTIRTGSLDNCSRQKGCGVAEDIFRAGLLKSHETNRIALSI